MSHGILAIAREQVLELETPEGRVPMPGAEYGEGYREARRYSREQWNAWASRPRSPRHG
jgi:hypothetical protein